MKINMWYGLPFVQIKIEFSGKELFLDNVLLDTGSAGSIFNSDIVRSIGVFPESNDVVKRIRGIGGVEYVYTKHLDKIYFERFNLENFQVEIGNMDYGMDIDGILGFDFISNSNLVIDTRKMMVYGNNGGDPNKK
ncbi:hypothetical protein J2Z83_002299 [Virgibacillus natechei]|uniref:Peptidase A2 domain-containing protein n=1 Tax=Virgibacillus natechei TaxID=1216297 RepID=A0ABS4IIB0_9BACI|nr:retropepsin-like aspartic protease [Virgibacillus natechei]MBP1970181.1 hypothetical protein [Virgibacillus natechei]UZD12867.1 retropepsin-like domain-containing protein [Virgibacillus natechei]